MQNEYTFYSCILCFGILKICTEEKREKYRRKITEKERENPMHFKHRIRPEKKLFNKKLSLL